MVKTTKTWNFPGTSQMNIFSSVTTSKKNPRNQTSPKKTFTRLKIRIYHSLYKLLWMLFSLSRLKSIEFTCSQIPLHYQFVKTHMTASTWKHATKYHTFLIIFLLSQYGYLNLSSLTFSWSLDTYSLAFDAGIYAKLHKSSDTFIFCDYPRLSTFL